MAAPDVAHRYVRDLAAEKRAALGSVRSSWRQMGDDFDASWTLVGPLITAAVSGAQFELATMAERYVAEVAPLTVAQLREADYSVNTAAWAGVAGDGRPVGGLAQGATVRAKVAVAQGATTQQALRQGEKWLLMAMATAMADTHRGAEQVAMRARRVGLYVRMLTGPSNCGRCVILAGRTYRSAQAFERHPQCDCIHIPASESMAGDLTTDPHAYLDSLGADELARVLGSKANAKAWKDGADVNQLVNAYRRKGGVQKAQLWGKSRSFTSEGVARGWARAAMRTHSGRSNVRLMPSSIYELAKDRAGAQRLLRLYGWIL